MNQDGCAVVLLMRKESVGGYITTRLIRLIDVRLNWVIPSQVIHVM